MVNPKMIGKNLNTFFFLALLVCLSACTKNLNEETLDRIRGEWQLVSVIWNDREVLGVDFVEAKVNIEKYTENTGIWEDIITYHSGESRIFHYNLEIMNDGANCCLFQTENYYNDYAIQVSEDMLVLERLNQENTEVMTLVR